MSYFIVSQNIEKVPIEIFRLTVDMIFTANTIAKSELGRWYYCPARFDSDGRVQMADKNTKLMKTMGPYSTHENAVSVAVFDLWCS